MNEMELTIEQQLKLEQLKRQVYDQEISDELIKEKLMNLYEAMMIKDNVMKKMIGEHWGIEGAKQQ